MLVGDALTRLISIAIVLGGGALPSTVFGRRTIASTPGTYLSGP